MTNAVVLKMTESKTIPTTNQAHVPKLSLSQLTCSNCTKYLSHFPIYSSEEKSICGRCTRPDKSFVRNDLFETLAKQLRFPCSNDQIGCTYELSPEHIPQHEKYCTFRIFPCPITECTWQGRSPDLLYHFESNHVNQILQNFEMEIDTVQEYSSKYLIPYFDQLFILNLNSDGKTLTCNMIYLGNDKLFEQFEYFITFCNVTQNDKFYKLGRKIDFEMEIKLIALLKELNSPVAVTAKIDIIHPKEMQVNENKESSTNEEMLNEIECPVCYEYLTSPIFQCKSGHNVCNICKDLIKQCPLCQMEIMPTRNLTLEKITAMLTCKCRNLNCKYTSKLELIREHEKTCIYGRLICPLSEFEGCEWKGTIDGLYEHIEKEHENILHFERDTVPFQRTMSYEDCLIIRHSLDLFKLHFKYENEIFYWSLQLIGPPEKCSKYMFEIDVVDNTGRRNRAFLKGPCSSLCKKDESFTRSNHLMFNLSQIKELITDVLTYRVFITQE